MKKNRKKIIIIIFILLLVFGALWFFGILQKNKQNTLVDKAKNLFPFGKIETDTGNTINNSQRTNGKNGSQTEQETENTPIETAGPRLRRISDFPTGGFAGIVRTENKEINDITINSAGETQETKKNIEVENNYVRYASIDNATIYESKITPSSISKDLVEKEFIPNVEHVLFSEDGNNVIFQYWNKKNRYAESYSGTISKREMNIEKCPYDFSKKIVLGSKGDNIYDLHVFLNKNKKTQIATSGINSPGNEGDKATASTITAIKNFQSLHNLDIDGTLGPATKKELLKICDAEQRDIAEQKFENTESKYLMKGSFLPSNIVDVSISPDGKDFFYLKKDVLGVVGIIQNFIDNSKKTVFESPYTQWLTQWNNKDNIEIFTKASYKSKGYSYALNPISGDYHKSLKQEKGLTTLVSPDDTKIFVHQVDNNSVINSIYNRKTHRKIDLDIQTFMEKCAWDKESIYLYCFVPDSLSYKNKYPDIWYQGLESYHDSLWKINSKTFKTEIISDISIEYGENLDISKIGIDKNSDYLYFIDKNTEFLWSYRLTDL